MARSWYCTNTLSKAPSWCVWSSFHDDEMHVLGHQVKLQIAILQTSSVLSSHLKELWNLTFHCVILKMSRLACMRPLGVETLAALEEAAVTRRRRR